MGRQIWRIDGQDLLMEDKEKSEVKNWKHCEPLDKIIINGGDWIASEKWEKAETLGRLILRCTIKRWPSDRGEKSMVKT